MNSGVQRDKHESADLVEISVIIVSYNTRETTLACLRRLFAAIGNAAAEVWVVDNDSNDGSTEAIQREFPTVQLLINGVNRGFGAANNQALAHASGEFVLLLNSDAFVEAEAIGVLIDYLRRHPRVAVAGPRLLNSDGTLQISCFRFPSPARAWLENLWVSTALPHHPIVGDYRFWAHDSERKVDFVIGACMLVRRAAYEEVGGFDERFFMYSEESDWQRRMRDMGWEVAFVPWARVAHLGAASGASDRALINRHFFDSLDAYVKKHHGLAGLISLRAAMAVGCLMRAGLWQIQAVFPKRRKEALAKARLHSWLFARQTTHWGGGKQECK